MEPSQLAAARTGMRARLGVPADAPLVTTVARLVPIKRVDLFLDAARRILARHPDAWFCVAGDGQLRDALLASPAARALGPRVVWPGFVAEMPALYAASDVVVLCSDNEGTPVSLIEALAAGVPVVATDVGGVPAVVRHGIGGLLAPRGDAAAIAGHAGRLLDDRALSAVMAAEGRRWVMERFELRRLVADVVALYRTAAPRVVVASGDE